MSAGRALPPPGAGAVLYQVYVRSFCDVDGDATATCRACSPSWTTSKSLGVEGSGSLRSTLPQPRLGYDVADYEGVQAASARWPTSRPCAPAATRGGSSSS